MSEGMSIEQRRSEVARLQAEGLSQREIAARLSVDHSTVTRDLAALRTNGAHQVAEGELFAADLQLVHQVAAAQPAAAAVSVADHGATQVAEVLASAQEQPWLERRISADEQLAVDVRTLRDLVAEHQPIGGERLRNLFTGGSEARSVRERFDVVFSRLQAADDIRQTADGVVLTATGQWIVAQEHAAPQQRSAPVDLATSAERYLAATDEALPVYEQLMDQLRAQELERRAHKARTEWMQVSHFARLPNFDAEWEQTFEPDLSAGAGLALRPRFPLPAGAELYLRVHQDHEDVWLRASTGGRYVPLAPGQGAREVEQALGLALRFGLEAAIARVSNSNREEHRYA